MKSPEDKKSDETLRIEDLRQKLEEGELSGMIENFDPEAFLSYLHKKYLIS